MLVAQTELTNFLVALDSDRLIETGLRGAYSQLSFRIISKRIYITFIG